VSLSAIAPAESLLAWYDRHQRSLPWRAAPGTTPDPYRVWLSEVMLQQTTVAAAIPYYERFVSQFPTIEALAAAPLDQVLAAWAGLGYYARARNLHACARAVMAAGAFPREPEALRALPGVGPYTATAIAAIAFGRSGVPVDGNVERVVARLLSINEPLPGAKTTIRAAAAALGPIRLPSPDRPILPRRCSILARRLGAQVVSRFPCLRSLDAAARRSHNADVTSLEPMGRGTKATPGPFSCLRNRHLPPHHRTDVGPTDCISTDDFVVIDGSETDNPWISPNTLKK
jgi:endonuclease III